MKYMTFNRSCSYAGIANLLEEYDIHYEDHEIAKALSLPYLFLIDPKNNCYVAGAMIQFKPWFNYFLNSISMDLIEKEFDPEAALSEFDLNKKRYMVGINSANDNLNSNHAVVFTGKFHGKYKFLNPKRENSEEPDYFEFDKEELLEKLPSNFIMGHLNIIKKAVPFDISNHLRYSLKNIDNYRNILINYCSEEQDVNSLKISKENLFAPMFLDVLAMMELIGETSLAFEIKNIRSNYINAINKKQKIKLSEYISLKYLDNIISKYKTIISNYMKMQNTEHSVNNKD